MRPITLTEPGTILPESELILNPDGSVLTTPPDN